MVAQESSFFASPIGVEGNRALCADGSHYPVTGASLDMTENEREIPPSRCRI